MFKSILVPLDGSTFAEQALPHAIILARQAQANVQLISVRLANAPSAAPVAEEKYLARIASQLEPELPGAITYEVVTREYGPSPDPPSLAHTAADAIARYASEREVELCVMATHGRGGVRRAWLGSVTDCLIRIAPRPVLLIRPKDEAFGSAVSADRGMHHIVILVDGSQTAEQVIPYALRIGTPFGAHYTLLRVMSPLVWGPFDVRVSVAPTPLTQHVAVDYVERLANDLRQQGTVVTTHVIEAVSPGPAIVEFAEAHAADAIALSTEGAGRVRRMLLGSVTDKVVRSSDVPVLVCNIRRLEPTTDLVQGNVVTALSAAP